MSTLKDFYLDPKTGFLGRSKLISKLKGSVPTREINDFYDRLDLAQIYSTNTPTYGRIYADKPGRLVADLVDMSNFAPHNHGYKWLLNIIDTHTRYAWSFPLKSKSPNNVVVGIKAAVNALTKPEKITLTTDTGSEFAGPVASYLRDADIKHYTMVASNSSKSYNTAHVESFNKTILGYLKRLMSINKLNYVDYLDDILYNYNHTFHSAIGATPSEVFEGTKQSKEKPHVNVNERANVNVNEFNLGDYVRYRLPTGTFAKTARIQRYSSDIYRIYDRHGYRYRLAKVNANVSTPLKQTYLARDLILVPPPSDTIEAKIETEFARANDKRVKRKLLNRRADIGEIDETAEIKIPKRLIPANPRRLRRLPARFVQA